MNAGCSGVIDQEEQFLHRIIDVIAFRVEREKTNLRYAGPVQIASGQPTWRKISLEQLSEPGSTR